MNMFKSKYMFVTRNGAIIYRNISKKLIAATALYLLLLGLMIFIMPIAFSIIFLFLAGTNIFVTWNVEMKAKTNIQNIVVGDIFCKGDKSYMVLLQNDNGIDYKIICLDDGSHHEMVYIGEYDFS
jgi:hypothetical protein